MTKTALVTGASSGIGYELAKVLAAEGYDLALVARRLDHLVKLKEECEKTHNVKAHILAGDLTVPDIAEDIYKELNEKNIQVDVLINNAGFSWYGRYTDMEWKKQSDMIQVNITALTQLTHLFLKGMVERKKGMVLNVASTAAFQPGPLMALYHATKAHVLFFSEALADELKRTGVSVTVLCPGATATEFQQVSHNEQTRLVKYSKLPTAKEVAEYGYRAMMKGKIVAVPGIMNKIGVFFVRLVSRKWTASAVHFLYKE